MSHEQGSDRFRFCPNCGAETSSGDSFCEACGHAVAATPAEVTGLGSEESEPVIVPTPLTRGESDALDDESAVSNSASTAERASQRPPVDIPVLGSSAPYGVFLSRFGTVFGWELDDRRYGSHLYLAKRSSLGSKKVLQRFPASEDGLSEAWKVIFRDHPEFAAELRIVTEKKHVVAQESLTPPWRPIDGGEAQAPGEDHGAGRSRFCPSCGTEALSDASFCGACGRLLGSRPVNTGKSDSPPAVSPGQLSMISSGPPVPSSHAGVKVVSSVFKFAAWLVLIFGVIASISFATSLSNAGFSGGRVFAGVVAGIFGTILAAAALAFFAYVLDLLMSIDSNTGVHDKN